MDAVTLPRENMLAVLKEAFPDGVLLTGADEVERYTRDWSGDHFGLPLAVARPRSVDEVSALMRCCSANAIPVVPQGGLTGLVGAAVAAPGGGEVVISLERMNRLRSISAIDFASAARLAASYSTR